MKCALCGHEFDPKRAPSACPSCPMARGCRKVRCPNCGYETVPDVPWVRRLADLFQRTRRKPDGL